MKSIREIDSTTDEGQLLIVILAQLSSQPGYSGKTADEILRQMSKLADEVYGDERFKRPI